MRLCIFNCLLLASVAAALPNGRHKRDLSYLKNLITPAFFGRSQINIHPKPVLQKVNGYKLFQLPRYDDVMIKVAPKKSVVAEFVYPPAVEQVNINAFRAVVGTKSKDDTVVAMKEVDNLLSTGMLYGGHNNIMKEAIVPKFPSINTANVVEEKIKTTPVIETRPVVTEVIENRPVFTEVIDNRPMTLEVIRPPEEKVELKVPLEPTYSYKQIQNNEPIMTYIAHNNPGVKVVETIKMKTDLPMCIKRVDEAIVLGADLNRFTPLQKVFQYQSRPFVDFSYPRVDTNSYIQNSLREEFAPVQEVFQYQSPKIFDFYYPRVESNSYAHNSFREEVVTEGFGTVADFGFSPQTLRPLKERTVRYNLRPTKIQAINPRPIPLHSHKSLHFEENINASKDKSNSPTKKIFKNLGEKVDISQILRPTPPQYIANLGKKDRNSVVSNGNMKQMKAIPIVDLKDNVSNSKILVNVNRLQSNPNTGNIVKGSDALGTNVKTNSNQYVIAPTVNRETVEKDTAPVENVVYSNNVTENPQNVTLPVTVASTNAPKQPLRENMQTSVINKTIPVKDAKNYSYQQKDADGSSLNVNEDIHGVSVSVKEKNNRSRGDIPDQ